MAPETAPREIAMTPVSYRSPVQVPRARDGRGARRVSLLFRLIPVGVRIAFVTNRPTLELLASATAEGARLIYASASPGTELAELEAIGGFAKVGGAVDLYVHGGSNG